MSTTNVIPNESLVRKIQLLLNLGERSDGNEAEAAAAMAKAQDLLAAYNLELADVLQANVKGGTVAREAETKRDYARSQRNATYTWTQVLCRALADANYCAYFVHDERCESKSGRVTYKKRHKVLGRVANTTAVLVMFDYLYATIMRLLPYDKSSWLSQDALAWCDGCVERLCERIAAKATAMKTADYATQGEQAYSTAIQVADVAKRETIANYDFIHGAGAFAKNEAYWSDEAVNARAAEHRALAAAQPVAIVKTETEAEKAKREREEAKQEERNAKWWEKYTARQERKAAREEARRSSDAFRSGRRQGNGIGLDGQVTPGTAAKELV